MSRRFCHVLLPVLAVVLAATSAAAGPVNSCVLQEDTAVGQFKLSTLDGLFGQLLTTESDGNIYFVSICRPIPQSFYDPRKLAGAIKLTSDGHTIDLGRIDQTNVIVNEDFIVLTYVGGDRDRHFRDICKGLRWKTYVMFVCDPSATKDILTLIDEDPDQPDICQVWFEIKTSKTCVQQPYVPLDILDKELSRHYKQIVNGKGIEILKIHSNEISAGNKLPNNGNHVFNTHQNSIKREVEENNNSQNTSSEGKPFTHPRVNSVIENETKNNEEKESHINKRPSEGKSYDNEENNISSREKPFININPNHIIKTKTINNEKKENDFHQSNSHTNSSENKPFINTYPNHIIENKTRINEKKENDFHQNNSHKINSDDEPFINTYPKQIDNKSRNNEKKENDFHRNNSHKLKPEDEPFMNIIPNHNVENETRNNEIEEHDFNQNNYHKNSSEYEPFMNIIPNHIIEKKTRNYEKKENNFHHNRAHNISSEDEPFTNSYPNHIVETKTKNDETKKTEFHQNKSHKIRPEDKRYINTNSDHISEKKSANNEKKEESSNQHNHEEKATHIKNNEEGINNVTIDVEHFTKYPENKSLRDKNNNLDKDSKHVNHEIQNRISSQNVTEENNSNAETNYSDKNKHISHYKSEDDYTKKHQNQNAEGLPVNSTKYEINKPTKNENSDRDLHKDISESTLHSREKYATDKSNKENKENISSQHATENHSSNNDVGNFSRKRAEHIDEENKWEKNHSADNSREEKSAENGKSTHNNNSETKPSHGGDRNSSSVHNARSTSKVDDLNENNATNVHYKHAIDHNSNRSEDVIKHQENGSTNIAKLKNDHENQSGEVENVTDKKHIDELHHYNSTNDKSEYNGTIPNQKYTKNERESEPRENPTNSNSSAHVFSDDNNNDDLKATDKTSQPGGVFIYFKNLYLKYFPNGFQLSTATIFGALGSLVVVFGLVGTAINRLYYKQTGTDQIPFKDTFLSAYSYITKFVTKNILCCCGRDLEEPDETNEKTPLLHPRNVPSPKVEDETFRKTSSSYQQQGSKNSANDDSSDKNRYGSTLGKTFSPALDSTYSKKKCKSKGKSSSSSDSGHDNESSPHGDKEKLIKVDNNLLGKPETEASNKKTNSTHTLVKNILRNSFRRSSKAGQEESGDNSGNTNSGTDAVRKSKKDKLVKKKSSDNDDSNDKNNKNRNDSTLDEKISPTFDRTYSKKKRNSRGKSTSSGDSDQDKISSSYGDKEELINVEDNLLGKPETEASNKKPNSTHTLVKNILRNSFRRSSKDGKEESGDNSGSTNFETDVVGKSKEDKIVKKKTTADQLAVPETKVKGDDDESVEYIEEIVYIEDGEEGEEIFEEIIETTTVEEVPETSDEFDFAKCGPRTASGAHGPTTVTVKTSVRKISSTSSPGEVKTTEETFVSDNSQKSKKKGFGFKLGIGGKSGGVNASVGEKKLGLSKSGIKFGKRKEQEDQNEQEAMTLKLDKSGFKVHRNKNKSPVFMDGEDSPRTGESDKRNTVSPEKAKKSKSKSTFKMFKRSISQPAVSDISEVENDPSPDETAVKTEVPTTSAGLLIFGKTRSRSMEGDKKRTL